MKIFLLICLTACSGTMAFAQKATIQVLSKNKNLKTVSLFSPNLKEKYLHEKSDWFWNFELDVSSGNAAASLNITEPVFMILRDDQKLNYSLFVSPGDDLKITLPADSSASISVSGKGQGNNQILNIDHWFNGEPYQKDTTPYRILEDLRATLKKDSVEIVRYIKKHNPTQAFIKAQSSNLSYFLLSNYHFFWGNHKFRMQRMPGADTLISAWENELQKVMRGVELNNPDAIVTPNYTSFVSDFLLRKKEELWRAAAENPGPFYREWYGTDTTEGKILFQKDVQNLLTERIINKYFTGAAAAFAYAHLINRSLGDKEDNLVSIFNRFEKQHPGNAYLNFLQPQIKVIKEKEARPITNKMIFIENSDSLKTFDEVLAAVKGKTVLLDMWGTWCGPCRQELDKHSSALKQHFKNKDVDFLYISNYDTGKDSLWRKLIAYYQLEGMHILASKILTDNILAKTGMKGFPTYLIIKKDGTYELSKAGYPMDRDALIKQIETAL